MQQHATEKVLPCNRLAPGACQVTRVSTCGLTAQHTGLCDKLRRVVNFLWIVNLRGIMEKASPQARPCTKRLSTYALVNLWVVNFTGFCGNLWIVNWRCIVNLRGWQLQVIASVDQEKHPLPDPFNHEEIHNFFITPEVSSARLRTRTVSLGLVREHAPFRWVSSGNSRRFIPVTSGKTHRLI